jgi:hypothetical protein
MGRSVTDIRELMRLAADLRRSAAEATLPGYGARLLRAAADIEAQAHLRADHINDPDFDEERECLLHRHVDINV